MVTLTIDDIAVEVAEGASVLEAARSVGITIPHFCWHPALGKAGACRACAVKMLAGPVKGIQMSCMLPVQNGMVVSTTDAEAVEVRRAVIEWLMINHPHDCPVCDEGGECQLQDFTIAGGHGIRRYDGVKRTHVNQYLGEQIAHEMNRCIHCYRCVRFYQEYAGGSDFGVMGRSASVYFGRQQDGALESPFSGNLVDICPTGVFTDKTARFRARYWDYDMAPSVCIGCSLGCNTLPMARYRELLKITARRNDTVNGWFLCDRGRFSGAAVNAPERPRQALCDGYALSLAAAIAAAAQRINAFIARHGGEAVAVLGSPRMSQEGNRLAAQLAERLGAGTLAYFDSVLRAERTAEAVELLAMVAGASQEDVRQADLVVLLECDVLSEAPMMALAVRQAWRAGAQIYVVGSECPLDLAQLELFESVTVASLAEVPFAGSNRPVVLCGTRHKGLQEIHAAAAEGARVAYLLSEVNDFGCATLARAHQAVPLSHALAGQRIKGIIAFEADVPLERLEGIEVLAVADWRATQLLAQAQIVLPVTAWVEMDGTYINHEGRAQNFTQVMKPGVPIKGMSAELHPPRQHQQSAPGSDLLPSWRVIEQLLAHFEGNDVSQP